MVTLAWSSPGSRIYENGLDRGVLYLPDGSAVPWNGLTSVDENPDKESAPVYFDGAKISDLVILGDFQATLKAVTYPDEFVDLEGNTVLRSGIYAVDQKPKTFGLCYRTRIGEQSEGDDFGYKINIIYNVTAIPRSKVYTSASNNPTIVEFEWDLTATPENLEGVRPTAHIVIDSTKTDPWLLEDIESLLYGTEFTDASLIPLQELYDFINAWYRVKVTDNGDGTWTAEEARPGFITKMVSGRFSITEVNAIYLTDYIWQLTDTKDITDVVRIRITYNGDETWTATATSDALIETVGYGEVQIHDANITNITEDTYQISDTIG